MDVPNSGVFKTPKFVRFSDWNSNEDEAFENHSVWKPWLEEFMTSIKQALNCYYGVLVDKLVLKRNEILLVLCVIALSLDPLFCYLLIVNDEKQCLRLDTRTGTIAVVLRSTIDFSYVIYIIFQFRASIVTLSSQTNAAVWRSFLLHLLVDILVILPLPQVLVFAVIPKLNDSGATKSLNFIFIIQYVLRVLRICSLLKIVLRNSGILAKSPWANLFFLMLASHVLGAFWYLFSIERKAACWLEACNHIGVHCSLYCGNTLQARTFLNDYCSAKTPNSALFDFGIYLDALASEVVHSADIVQKISYCFWWGLQNLSSLGQSLKTSTYVWEIYFSVFVSISGLLSFAFLIGNLQAYLLSEVARSEEMRAKTEEMRLKRKEMESWMAFCSFPENLNERILQTIEGKLKENIVINTHSLLHLLPLDLRKDAIRHLGLGLLRRVPMFEKMEEQLLDVMCDRLELVLYTMDNYNIVREGDPVDKMLFIVRGKLVIKITNVERTGFFNSMYLKAGDFCGEELLTWALDPYTSSNLPISTRTVRAHSEVEAFALKADDLKFVASQFRRRHGKQLRHTFRFYSQQWRTWAACFIQEAWRRYSKKKLEESLREEENRLQDALAKAETSSPSLGATIYASRFAANVLRAVRLQRSGTRKGRVPERIPPMLLQKPAEPDFTAEEQ